MSSIAQPVDSGRDKVATSDRNGKGCVAPLPPSDFDAGYKLLESHEIDPNPDKLPPDLRDGLQAALHSRLRGFVVIQLLSNGTPAEPDWRSGAMSGPAGIHERWTGAPKCKVGGIAAGLVVLALTGPEGVAQYRALATITNTAAVLSRVGERYLLFFSLPAGVRSVEGTLLPGVDMISSDYVALPSGNMTDGCCWANRYKIATAPQWLIDQLAALAASQAQTEENDDIGAGSVATDTTFHTAAFLLPGHVLSENAEGGIQ